MENKKLFTLELCKTKAAYSAKLVSQKRLNLKKIREVFEVVSDAGIALVLRVNEIEVVVHQFGEISFKTADEGKIKEMERIAHKIYKAGLDL